MHAMHFLQLLKTWFSYRQLTGLCFAHSLMSVFTSCILLYPQPIPPPYTPSPHPQSTMDLLFSWAGRLVSERNISLYALRQHTEALTQATDKVWGLYEDTREINPRKAGLIHHPPHPSRNQPPHP